eukprot:scaffold992_cov387-Prasinococcus_capsulatus_cf.AAC.8
MSFQDPYYLVHDEIEANLSRVRPQPCRALRRGVPKLRRGTAYPTQRGLIDGGNCSAGDAARAVAHQWPGRRVQ